MNADYIEIPECIACGSTSLEPLISLNTNDAKGVQPLANSLVDSETTIVLYPLKAVICTNCTHIQLSHAVHPSKLFENYLYVSGTSITLREYFDSFVNLTTSRYSAIDKSNVTILDIGCNDGTLLDVFRENGYTKTYGIDPSDVAKTNNQHIIYNDYFELSHEVSTRKYDIIIAQNVFAHSCKSHNEAIEFLNKCSSILSNTGSIYIQFSQTDMIENSEFDTIYHEHLSFYNNNSFCSLLEAYNKTGIGRPLYIKNYNRAHIHGKSSLYELSFSVTEFNKQKVSPKILRNLIENYINNISIKEETIPYLIHYYKSNGYKIIGLGAPAKATVTINHYGISHLIDYIVDENPLKQGKFIPSSTKIPILDIETLKTEAESEKILLIPFAWNFLKEMMDKTKARLKSKDVRCLNINDLKIYNANRN